jgi:hypothetical protein
MKKSWIAIQRSLLKAPFYKKDHDKVFFWVHLNLIANWDPTEEVLGGKVITCQPGQFTTGRKQLADQTGFSESKVERLLTYFEKIAQRIEQRKTSTNRLITILYWSRDQQSGQQNGQRVNNDRTTSEQRSDTLEQYNNSNNSNNKEILKENFSILKGAPAITDFSFLDEPELIK